MDCSAPGLPVRHQLPELAQTHVHRVSNTIPSSHPLLPPSPPAFHLPHESALRVRGPKHWSVSFSTSPSGICACQMQRSACAKPGRVAHVLLPTPHPALSCVWAGSSCERGPSEPQGPFTGSPLSPTALAPGRYTFLYESLSTKKLDWKNHRPPLGGQSVLGASLPRSVQLGPARNAGADGLSWLPWFTGVGAGDSPETGPGSTRHRPGP